MNNWFETFEGLRCRVWETLARGVADAGDPARLINFATVSQDGWPELRTVVLRSANPEDHSITVHTDLHSDKIRSLRAHPRAALHLWDAGQDLQLRMQANVSIASGDATRALWDMIPDHAQQSYGVVPPPGAPIKAALDYVKQPDPATFAVLTCQIVHIDVVHLGADHRRAQFTHAGHWVGQWLSP
ncbi:Pyridoxamine 5'-phosphate oxidase [Yoonia tamlensis]|uniref:Pyridoxamine 5'-phosphate oxidase n=1 Tax=Yoonia tamlensis TaxID=390270 RepID=A0A1I6FNW4_9RHOB|nr:pyridoxamine 5'-phosphate oxidase family protein [Yoonia tamlensis]SFR31616.1 Pyridoxamine 5'-phosphate oxidase [Yoonia tamlensis]